LGRVEGVWGTSTFTITRRLEREEEKERLIVNCGEGKKKEKKF